MAEQLTFNFDESATQRRKRAAEHAAAVEQPTLFAAWSPNIDVHLHSPSEAIAQIAGLQPERAHDWIAGIVGNIRELKPRRVAFAAGRLDRLLYVRPPAQVTVDASATAVGRALWAAKLGLKPLRVRRDRQRLIADSPRWPKGLRVRDAPWTAIATIVNLGLDLTVDDDAQRLLRRKLEQAGTKVAIAGLAGSAVLIETRRPEIVESLALPGLAYTGEPGTGTYKLPLLAAGPLLQQNVIDVPGELRAAISRATAPVKPLRPAELGADFPWKLYDFQAEDAARAIRILETTGGVLLAGDMGAGKAISTETVLYAPTGPRRAGDIEVGDLLMGLNGRPTTVLGVYPQGRRPLFRVTFTDGRELVADAEHLWSVSDGYGGPAAVLTTAQLTASGLCTTAGESRWHVPLCAPVQFRPDPLLAVDPYALGVRLATGAQGRDGTDFDLGRHLYAPEEERRALLRGLLSATPGAVIRSGSEQHVDAVRHLVETLGGTARKEPTASGWTLSVRLSGHAGGDRPDRAIAGIEPAGDGDAVCFMVDAPDHLFLAEGAIPVHNTTIALGLAQHMDIWPLLVVAPLSAFSTWDRQLHEMGRATYLATGSLKRAWTEIEQGTFDAVVLSYDRLPAFTELVERMAFRGIVADEIQRIRTAGSRRSRALRALAASVPLRLGLSGTPLTNTVADLLPVGAFLAPGEWRPRANNKDLEDMYPGDPIEAVAEHLGSLMVRRRMQDTGAVMPRRRDHRVKIDLTVEQRRALADLEAEAEQAKRSGAFDNPQGRFHAFAKLQKQRQIINSPRAAGIPGPNPKVMAAMKLAEDFLAQGRNGVLFCADRTTFRELGDELDARGIGWVGIWGSTPAADRIKHERMFHAGATAPNGHPTRVVLCTIQAGSESWSASPTATWLISTAYMYAPAVLAQMECRVYRLNSDADGPDIEICYIHAKAPGGSLDDRMVEILEVKKELFAQVVDRTSYVDSTQVHLSMGDLMYLLTGERDGQTDKLEADGASAAAREQAMKDHARRTLYRGKRGNADLVLDDGSQALTRDEYADLDGLVNAADTDDTFEIDDIDQDDAEFDVDVDDLADTQYAGS